jgi:hypothetical protein
LLGSSRSFGKSARRHQSNSPRSSVKLAEIISKPRRDHQQTSPRSSANLTEIISNLAEIISKP